LSLEGWSQQCQRLALGFKPCNDLMGVRPQLHHFDRGLALLLVPFVRPGTLCSCLHLVTLAQKKAGLLLLDHGQPVTGIIPRAEHKRQPESRLQTGAPIVQCGAWLLSLPYVRNQGRTEPTCWNACQVVESEAIRQRLVLRHFQLRISGMSWPNRWMYCL
jgi:hypothetical protein